MGIDEFLAAHPSLLPLIEEAQTEITHYFPAGTTTRLDVRSDPEYPQEEAILFILVDTAPEQASRALTAFDYGWWLAHLHEKLCITLEFV